MKKVPGSRRLTKPHIQYLSRGLTAFILLGIVFLLSGCASGRTWNDVFVRDGIGYGWRSGDGAYTIELPGNRILWLFGDSLVIDRDGNTQMVRNSIAVHPARPDGTPPDKARMRFYARDENGRIIDITCRKKIAPQPLRAWADPAGWLWPKDGAMIGDALVIFYARIGCSRGRPPGCAGEWSWEKVDTFVLVVDNPQDDVTRWRISIQKTDLGKEEWGCALYYEAPYLYLFGVDENHDGRYAKYRVDHANVRNFADWKLSGVTNHIARKLPTEFSVDKVTLHGISRYVMVHQKLILSHDAVVRVSDRLDHWPGDVSGPHVWIGNLQAIDPSVNGDRLIWAVKGHAELSEPCRGRPFDGAPPERRPCMLINYYSQQLERLRFFCFPFAEIEPW